jgi:choline kinase
MKKAIILDAGEGKRLRPLTENLPKCLIKIGNKTILEHQIFSLMDCGIRELVLVIGYGSSMILKKLEESSFDLETKYVRNPIYYKTNTVYSLWLARNEMDTDFLYLNGDVFFHKGVLKRLIDAKHDTCLAIDMKRKIGEEEVKVKIAESLVKDIGKEIEPLIANGEFVGVAKFSKEINVVFKKRLDEVVKEGKLNAFFELSVQRMLNDCDVYAVDVSDLPCIEIDTYNDLEEARNIFPKIRDELK